MVTFFGLVDSEGFLLDFVERDGLRVYSPAGPVHFSIVVEGKPGLSGADVGSCAYEPACGDADDPDGFPDLQIEVSNPLGNGSPAVCDASGPNAGGVPPIWPVDFTPTATNIGIVNDLACRFVDGNSNPVGRPSTYACVIPDRVTQEPDYADPTSKIEFCALITQVEQFAVADTVVTARLRDVDGNVGAPAQIIIHVGP